MANTTYQSPQITNQAQRRTAYNLLSSLLDHLEALGIDLVSINVSSAPVRVTIVLDDPLPVNHEDHFKLTKV
jgi:hypothetical protein